MQRMPRKIPNNLCQQPLQRRIHLIVSPGAKKEGNDLITKTRQRSRNSTNDIYSSSRELFSQFSYSHINRLRQQVRTIAYAASDVEGSKPITDEDTDRFMSRLEEASLRNRPYGYYEILGGIPRTSKLADIKHAYFRLAKRYHPDAYSDKDEDTPLSRRNARVARFKFDEITEAYQTLMDINQRHFYDQHGFAADALRKQGLPTIFDYVPKYGIYEEQILSDNETTGLEDWFAAQGHSVRDPNITIRQRLKNAYIELKWGLAYHNFPWKIKEFCLYFLGVCIFSGCLGWLYGIYIRRRVALLPDDHPHKPIQTNNKWENDDIRDILKFYGIRKKNRSELSRAGNYHMPKTGAEEERRKQNMLDGKLFTERQYQSWKENSSKRYNMSRHITWLKEEKERKIQLTIEKRQYWESRIGSVVAEIEKFKLDEHILKQAEESLAGKSKTELILSYDEVEQLRKNHNTTNMVALNSKLEAAKSELDQILSELELLEAPIINRIEDQYILPPTPGAKDFKVSVGEANLSVFDLESNQPV